jgi:hypothetical protein
VFATVNANGTLAVAIVCADMMGTLINRDNVTIARIPKTFHFIVFSLEVPHRGTQLVVFASFLGGL